MKTIAFALIGALLLGVCCGCGDGEKPTEPENNGGGTSQAQPGDEKTPKVETEKYTSETGGFSLELPKGWKFAVETQNNSHHTVCKSTNGNAAITVAIEKAKGRTLDEIVDRNVKVMTGSTTEISTGKLDGLDSKYCVTDTKAEDGVLKKAIILFAAKGDFVYGLLLACPPDEFENFRKDFDIAVGSFRIEKQPQSLSVTPIILSLRSETGGFALNVPEAWKQHASDGETKFVDPETVAEASAYIKEEGINEPTARISVQVIKLAEGTDLAKFAADKAAWFENTWSANDGMQTNDIEFGGIKGVEHSMKHLTLAGGADFARLIVGVKDGYGYIVHTRRADVSGEYDTAIDEIVKSFKIESAPKPPANAEN